MLLQLPQEMFSQCYVFCRKPKVHCHKKPCTPHHKRLQHTRRVQYLQRYKLHAVVNYNTLHAFIVFTTLAISLLVRLDVYLWHSLNKSSRYCENKQELVDDILFQHGPDTSIMRAAFLAR